MRFDSDLLFGALLAIGAVGLIQATGCTFEPGEPWGYLDIELHAGALQDSGSVDIGEQHVTLEELQLLAPAGTADAIEEFDPADPPPGFELCHDGHCHHEDGGLYTYEEIAAGIGDDDSGSVVIARGPLQASGLDLSGGVVTERQFRIVDQTTVDEVSVIVEVLELEATMKDDDKAVDLDVEIRMASRPLGTDVLYEFGRDEPEHQQLALRLHWPDDLFEDLAGLDAEFEQADDGDTIHISEFINPDLRDELRERIADGAEVNWQE